MLTIENVRSASAGTSYYMSCSYFSSGDEGKLQYAKWYGETAQSLDLKDDVEIDKFNEILKGVIEDEDGATQLGRKNKEGQIQHDCARDLTFAVPKSVSLQHNLKGGDDRIKDAILTSVAETIAPNLLAVAIACNPATPAPTTKTFAAGTVPAAVIIIGIAFSNSYIESTTDLYPAKFDCDDKTSID